MEKIIDSINNSIKEAFETDKQFLENYTADQILVHCFEEMAECAAALSKYYRIHIDGTASIISEDEALAHAKEELADALSMGLLFARKTGCLDEICNIHVHKSKEFIDRM